MSNYRIIAFSLNLIFLSSMMIPRTYADSHGKFPGIGSVKAYNQTVNLISEADKLSDAGKFESAILLYRKAIAIYPNDSNSHQSLAIALRKVGKFDESISEDKKAIELEPNYLSAWLNMGVDYEMMHNYADAERCYRKAVQIKPDDYTAVGSLGDALKEQGRLTEARQYYLRAKDCPGSKHYPGEIDEALRLLVEQEKKVRNKEESN